MNLPLSIDITVRSDQSNHVYPFNTNVQFIANLFPCKSLHRPIGPHGLALKTLICRFRFRSEAKIPSYIEVHINQVTPLFDEKQSYTTCIAEIPIATKNISETSLVTIVYENTDPIYFPLWNRVPPLQHISCSLFGPDGVALDIIESSPTILHVRVGKMDENLIHLACSSRMNRDLYQRNSITNFTCNIPQLDRRQHGFWEMAIKNIVFSKGITCNKTNGIITLNHHLLNNEGVIETFPTTNLTIKLDSVINVPELLKQITTALPILDITFSETNTFLEARPIAMMKERLSHESVDPDLSTNKPQYIPSANHVSIRILPSRDQTLASIAEININPDMALALGYSVTGTYDWLTILFYQRGQYSTSYTFPDKPSLERVHPSVLFLHTNIIQPSLMGSNQEQILGVIPSSILCNGDKEISIYNSPHLFFHKIQQTVVRSLSFHIKTFDDEDAPLYTASADDCYVTINLLLRKTVPQQFG